MSSNESIFDAADLPIPESQLQSFQDKAAKSSTFNSSLKQFWVIGFPIAKSKSPLIHNTGYKVRGLPHTFGIHEVRELDEGVKRILDDELFGGAAITMPFKLPIMGYLQDLTQQAKALGAVNTVIRSTNENGERILVGDNTDWLGIYNVLSKGLRDEHKRTPNSTALVIGAGGAGRAGIYALQQLGIKTMYLYNRTSSNSAKLVTEFSSPTCLILPIPTLSLASYTHGAPLFVVGTVPASGTFLSSTPSSDGLVPLSADIFSRPEGGVMLDMAYLPKRTPLIQLAERAEGWCVNPGIMVLLGQAFGQFRIWTGVSAPEEEMGRVVLEVYEREAAE